VLKPISRRNIILLVASAVWVLLGILEFKIASWMEQGQGGDAIRADVCLFPIALGLTCWAFILHFRSLKPGNCVPADSGCAETEIQDGHAEPGDAAEPSRAPL
jgi:hypothetical protein